MGDIILPKPICVKHGLFNEYDGKCYICKIKELESQLSWFFDDDIGDRLSSSQIHGRIKAIEQTDKNIIELINPSKKCYDCGCELDEDEICHCHFCNAAEVPQFEVHCGAFAVCEESTSTIWKPKEKAAESFICPLCHSEKPDYIEKQAVAEMFKVVLDCNDVPKWIKEYIKKELEGEPVGSARQTGAQTPHGLTDGFIEDLYSDITEQGLSLEETKKYLIEELSDYTKEQSQPYISELEEENERLKKKLASVVGRLKEIKEESACYIYIAIHKYIKELLENGKD
jgi:hypothetical protein